MTRVEFLHGRGPAVIALHNVYTDVRTVYIRPNNNKKGQLELYCFEDLSLELGGTFFSLLVIAILHSNVSIII